MPRETFGEQLWRGLGEAVQDIREKVVEEPLYGRVVNERDCGRLWPQTEEVQKAEPEHDKERDIDMDR